MEAFEYEFADYVGADYAIAVANGTAALHLCALALGVDQSSRVITTPITFAASANCVRYCGGTVEFADIDEETATLSLDKVRELLQSHPKGTYQGIIPVDFAGYPVDLEKFRELADEYGLWLLEDACHAPGGYFTDSLGAECLCGDGTYAELAIFSFHPVKHIACGEGGMITTNSKELCERIRLLRTHGITKDPSLLTQNEGGWYYEMQDLGFNYRLSDIHSALGLSQLKRADQRLQRRREIAAFYDKAFEKSSIQPVIEAFKAPGHAYHLYVVKVDERKKLYDHLRDQDIYSQVHYIPVHLQPYYRGLGHKPGDFPVAEAYYSQCLSLPMYPELTESDLNRVVDAVLSCCN